MAKEMKIKIIEATAINGEHVAVGATPTLDEKTAKALITMGRAREYVEEEKTQGGADSKDQKDDGKDKKAGK